LDHTRTKQRPSLNRPESEWQAFAGQKFLRGALRSASTVALSAVPWRGTRDGARGTQKSAAVSTRLRRGGRSLWRWGQT